MSHAAGILVSQAAGVLRTQLKALAGAPLVQLAWAAQLVRDAELAWAALQLAQVLPGFRSEWHGHILLAGIELDVYKYIVFQLMSEYCQITRIRHVGLSNSRLGPSKLR